MGRRRTVILTESVTEASYAQFKHRTSHVPNLIPSSKYRKRLTFESIKSNTSNLGQPMNQVRMAYMGILTVEQLHFKHQTFHVLNQMHQLP